MRLPVSRVTDLLTGESKIVIHSDSSERWVQPGRMAVGTEQGEMA